MQIERMGAEVSRWLAMRHVGICTVGDQTVSDFFASEIKMQSANGVEAVGEDGPREGEKSEVGCECVLREFVEEGNSFGVARVWCKDKVWIARVNGEAYTRLHVCSNGSISTATPFSSSSTLAPPNSSFDPLNARTLPFCSSHTVLISLPKYTSYIRILSSEGNRKNRLPSCSYVI
jgi:hypothetical protein